MTSALIAIASLLGLLILGVPMVAALLVAVALNFYLGGQWGMMLPQTMVSGVSQFTLLALPLFVLAGVIMNAGGISGRLFEFARALVGWMRGGLAQVNVLTSMFFGGMIGSSTADLAGSSSILIPAMKREGYPGDVAAAVSASSCGIGPLIPPSSPMILYSAITGTSLGALFLAGLIPGILLGLTFMVLVMFLAWRRGWRRHGSLSGWDILRSGRRASLAFGMPAIIVGGLAFGVFTPSEAGAFAVVYAILVSVFAYRTLHLRELYRVFVVGLQLTGELLIIVSLSFALGASLSSAHVPQILASVIDVLTIGDGMFARLLVLVILAVLAGMFLDPLIPVLVPVILPTLLFYDADLLHFGVLMVMSVVIGQLTPPLAIALIITGRIAGVDQMRIFVTNLPFLLTLVAFTLVLMAFPGIATWLPSITQ
ncbi:TRAP transporter large permease [Spiribacter halobius]|uniref:TRAP transporter large permease protein n=1 Tax=Sediminicurvatus halobius TaxID=2182432 RepID=A0A2U2N0Z4_9GAMM|nr:TRAP transporter large permease [Spiribacter halobius]PWG62727.1 TRAP transporter large permease [Spiribacter halobius]UEX77396.1 TRAP transporter large permease [Spiribacter halobius]